MDELVTGLDEASTLIKGAVCGDVIVPDSMIAGRETLGAAVI
tara:strand:+ start:20774 stop:20899 length:126 start_codon:yes stop_codon:yes gene_type:complete